MDENRHGRRGGVPALVWCVAGALWTVTLLAVALVGDGDVSSARALLYAGACVAVGSWTEVIASTVPRWTYAMSVGAVVAGSLVGRGYLDSSADVTEVEVGLVVGVSVLVFGVSRALASQIVVPAERPAPWRDTEPSSPTSSARREDLSRD